MNVVKRDGSIEPYSEEKLKALFEKVNIGFKNECKFEELIEQVQLFISDGIKTIELENILIKGAIDKITTKTIHWNNVAGRLVTRGLYKWACINRDITHDEIYTPKAFLSLYNSYIKEGLYTERFKEIYSDEDILKAAEFIKPERDNLYTYSTALAYKKRYLLNPNGVVKELPQEMYLAIALYLAIPEKDENRLQFVKELYDACSSQLISLPTPTLLNARTKKHQLSSCFEVSIDDDLESIFNQYRNMAMISKLGGGIGSYFGHIRAKGGKIRHEKGVSGGVMPFLKITNDIGTAVNQMGKRNGAISTTLDVWHKDIYDFLGMQTETGDIRSKCFDLFPAISIPDLFMERSKNNEKWSLFDPHEIFEAYGFRLEDKFGDDFKKLYEELEQDKNISRVELSATDLFKTFLKSVVETGMPYVFFRDTVNKYNPNKHAGDIYCTNLCVTGDTKILTKKYGNIEIGKVAGETLECWNGEEWSNTKLFQTSDGQYVSKVNLSNGRNIEATNYHRWIVVEQDKYGAVSGERIVETKDLKVGDKLSKFALDIVDHGYNELDLAYENGFFTGDGTLGRDVKVVYLYDDKQILLPRFNNFKSIYSSGNGRRKSIIYDSDKLKDKYFIPSNDYSLKSRLLWLAGYFDADGTLTNNSGSESIQAVSINKDFLIGVQDLLQEIGVQSRIQDFCDAGMKMLPDGDAGYKEYYCKKTYRIIISGSELIKLLNAGYVASRVMPTYRVYNREARQFIKVLSIDKNIGVKKTYCGSEPRKNQLMFNGVKTMNCTEIAQNNSYSKFIKEENDGGATIRKYSEADTVVCNLASINIAKVNTESDIKKVIPIAMRALDNVITLNLFPIEEAKITAEKYRSVGLGFLGLAEYLACNKLAYSSQEARDHIDNLFETYGYYTIKASNELAKERGAYQLFEGSEWSKGVLWGKDLSQRSKEWGELIEDVKKYGVRFSYHQSPAPNTSTAGVMGTTAGLLPIYKRSFSETNSFATIVNVAPNLNKENFWYYQEYNHLDMKDVIDMIATVQKWIDQSISFEWQIDPSKVSPKDLYDYYFYAWNKGIKTVYYVRSMSGDAEACISCSG